MADERLLFPVGFDLSSAADDALKDWDKIQKQMQKAVDGKPLLVQIGLNTTELDKNITSINSVTKAMKALSKEWDDLAANKKYDIFGNLTEEGNRIVSQYQELSAAAQTYGKTLQQITSEAKKQADAEVKAIDKKRAANDKYFAEQKREQEAYFANLRKEEYQGLSKETAEIKQLREYYTELEKTSKQEAEQLKKREEAWERYYSTLRKQSVERISAPNTASEDDRAYYAELERMSEKRIALLNKENQAKQANFQKQRKAGLQIQKVLQAEENSIASINAKLAIQKQRLEGVNLSSAKFNKITAEIKRLSAALGEANAKVSRMTSNDTITKQDRFNKSLSRTNSEYKTQSWYLSRLIERMAIYFSFAQAFSFVKQIREVTAEFELQRVALGALIQDTGKATLLFNQIKEAAVESPFQIKDLVTYTKQLAAYRIEQEELFDWTQRLADISAGLGTEMSRLILAFGQIRATGYLRGSEVRQLTEAGIPIVEALAEKFTKLKGEMVSSVEVFDMISNKAVSFTKVKEVFEDMTNAGGMFYQMQKKQAKTMAGMWSNLIDVMNIAQAEIGEELRPEIEALIKGTKELWTNWRQVVKVLQVGAGALGAYLLYTKSVTVAQAALVLSTNAVARSKAKEAILDKAKMLYMPKVVASIIGETTATKLAVKWKDLYAAASIKAALASNVFSKALWSVTTALLANPFAIAVAAIGALVTAMFVFRDKAETTAEKVERLNAAVGKLANIDKGEKQLDALIDSYDKLANKAEKTTDELKKLKDVSTDLANTYPSAIEGVDKLTGAYIINIEKVKELREQEKKNLKEETKRTLSDLESQLKELGEKRDKINKRILQGTKIVPMQKYIGGELITIGYENIKLTEAELSGLRQSLLDISPVMTKLTTDINTARRTIESLGKKTDKTKDSFFGWQETLSKAKKEFADGTEIKLFDEEEIQRLSNLNDALEDIASRYKDANTALEQYEATKKDNKNLTDDEIKQLEAAIKNEKTRRDLAYQLLQNYQALGLIEGEKDLTKQRINALNEEVSLVQEVYKRYKEYSQYKAAEQSKKDISKLYGDTLKGLKLEPSKLTFSDKELKDYLKGVQAEYEKLGETEKALKIGIAIDDISFAEAKDKITKEIANLQKEIDITNAKQDFFNNILGLTGDQEMAASITMSIYGGVEDDFGKGAAEEIANKMKQQLQAAFGDIDITKYISGEDVDYKGLDKLVKELGEAIPESQKTLIEGYIGKGLAQQAKETEDLIKSLDIYKTYEDKKTAIKNKGQKEREDINKKSIEDDKKQILIEASYAKERKKLLDLDIKNLKDFQLAFSDSKTLSKSTLKKNLDVLNFALKGITDPEQIKLFKEQIAEIEETLMNAFSQSIETDPLGLIKLYNKQIYYENKINKAKREGKEISQEDLDAQLYYSQKVKEGLMLSGVNFLVSGLQKSAELMKQIAELSGDIELEELGEKMGALAQNFSAAGQGAASGGWIGAIVGGVTDILNQTIEAFATAKLEAAEAAVNARDYADALELVKLTIDESKYGDIFGSASISMAADAYTKGQKALEKYNKVISETSDTLPSIKEDFTNIGAAIFISAWPFAFLKKETNESKAAIDAFIKGYDKLESMLIKTKNYSGWANLWGKQDEFTALKDLAPEIWQDGVFNIDNAKAFLETNTQIVDTQKKQIQQVIDLEQAYQDAVAAIDKVINDSFGNLSTDLADVIWNSVANGTNAWKDFKDVGAEAIAALGKQMLQEFILSSYLEEYRDRMRDAFGGDNPAEAMRDVVSDIFSNMGTMIQGSEQVAMEWQRWMKENGYKLQEKSELEGMAKNFANASETAILGLTHAYNTNNFYVSGLYGQVGQILYIMQSRYGINGATSLTLSAQQNEYLSSIPTIAQNTANTVAECAKIVRETKRTADILDAAIRPNGVGATKAIKTV